MRTRFTQFASGLLLMALVIAAPALGQVAFNQIAITGTPAPGVADAAEFDSFGPPTLNASGDVAFQAELRTGAGSAVTFDNNSAIFGPSSGAGPALGLIVRADAPAPGVTDAAEFSSFGLPALNSSGDVAFETFLRTGTGETVIFSTRSPDFNGQAIFGPSSGAGSSLGLIARADDPPPGIADAAEFDFFKSPSLNASGDVAFEASLRTGTGEGVTGNAIFGPSSGAGSSLGLIAREDDPAPGVADAAEFSGFASPALNASGDVAFRASLRTGTGPAVTPFGPDSNSSAIFGPLSGAGSALGLIARADDPAPGVADAAEFSGFLFSPALNASGDVAFQAELRTGAGAAVTLFGPDSNNSAIFGPLSGAGSALGLIARADAPAPGATDAAEFSNFGFGLPALNSSGDVAFKAVLRTGAGESVTGANNNALFATVDGVLELIVRSGDLLDVEVDGLIEQRTISNISFNKNGFNDNGELAFALTFTDGTAGIFTASVTAVPEPGSLVLLAFGGIGLLKQRRRR